MIPEDFKLYKAIDPFLKTANDYIDSKWGKAFKEVAKKTLIKKEKDDSEETKLTNKGFIAKYGIDSDDYDDLNFRKTVGMKNIPSWRWTDARLANAIRKLTASTNNTQLVKMLQTHTKTIPSIKQKGVRTGIPSSKTKFG